MAVLTKESIEKFVKEYEGSLYIETYHQSRSTHWLKLHTTGGGRTLGKVPKNIFKWFDLEMMNQQPPYINVSWRKFKSSVGVG